MHSEPEPIGQAIADGIRAHVQQQQAESLARGWPLACNTLEAEEIIAAVDVLLSGRITMGPRVSGFERAWSDFLGVQNSVMVNSGSSANLLAMSALTAPICEGGLKPGDEVIVPAVTWPTTVFPIAQVGCVPVLVDVDPDTLNITPDAIRRAITPKTRAIIPVHLLGNPCDMPEIQHLADEHNLRVIEDCCEAHGARVGDRPVGTFGEMSTFSFYFSHHMTTIEGGMISVRDDEQRANYLLSARSHGWVRQRGDRDQLARRFSRQDDRWLFVTPGYNLRPMELNAAIGLIQLRKLGQFISQRAEVRGTLLRGLADCEDVLQFQRELPGHFHSAFGFAIVVREQAKFTRDELRAHLETFDIETRPVLGGNLARQPALRHITWRADGDLPTADMLERNGLMIGINPGLSNEQIEYVIERVRRFVKPSGGSSIVRSVVRHPPKSREMKSRTALDLASKRIAVTGGAGFLGRSVVAKLREAGCGEISVPRQCDYDLRTERGVARFYDQLRPEVVIHLAAVVGGIGANRDNPGAFFYDNAVMGVQLIEFARRAGIEKFVCIGTVCSYPKFNPVPFREQELWNGYPEETNAPYGLAKRLLLVQAQAYRRQYGLNAIYLIPVNLYGPGDNFSLTTSHVIPAMLRKCVEAKEANRRSVTLWGDGSPTREFLYVDDAAEGIVRATRLYDGAEPVNLGAGREISIRDLARLIAARTGFEGEIRWDTSRPNGQPRRCIDTTRAKAWFGFEASTSFDEGLRATCEWYRKHRQETEQDEPCVAGTL